MWPCARSRETAARSEAAEGTGGRGGGYGPGAWLFGMPVPFDRLDFLVRLEFSLVVGDDARHWHCGGLGLNRPFSNRSFASSLRRLTPRITRAWSLPSGADMTGGPHATTLVMGAQGNCAYIRPSFGFESLAATSCLVRACPLVAVPLPVRVRPRPFAACAWPPLSNPLATARQASRFGPTPSQCQCPGLTGTAPRHLSWQPLAQSPSPPRSGSLPTVASNSRSASGLVAAPRVCGCPFAAVPRSSCARPFVAAAPCHGSLRGAPSESIDPFGGRHTGVTRGHARPRASDTH
jgi:hypothetical protein